MPGEKSLKDLEGEITSIESRPNRKDCLWFICPVCPGGHAIMVSWLQPSLVDSGFIWTKVSGETIDDITIHPSVDCTKYRDGKPSGCGFHGWVKNGRVSWY